ncbi:EamA-like transporter family protein [Pontibacter ummariensis]|uniref:EamA-like transporter family protein n=1 Tax=Pontibacter ummariensis TaxID=1610492 RepID=A0A239EE57_9BACT|nr:DMT family transporter [Pontibacter ummariensis]PRY13205.1 EamA-like transporter family protein [Pontibacter ummariensis]SNS42721.1 EamA-like transporter family protein [Pontibacter ummariensis]
MPRFKEFLELHFVIFLWGFTAILGKLISIPAVELVTLRTLITALALGLIIYRRGTQFWLGGANVLKIVGVGFIIAAHWILFFAAARISSVSICLVGMATCSLWTAFLEPLFSKSKVKPHEIVLALFIILGLYVIFQHETKFESILGIAMAVGSALLASIFTIINAKLVKKVPSTTITCYEMAGACLGSTLFFPVYTAYFAEGGALNFTLSGMDWVYLLILSLACTVYAYTAGVRLMQRISAYTMNLTVNLEPVYGIILAFIIFKEGEQLSAGFYYGAFIILMSIFIYPVLDTYVARRQRLKQALPDKVVLGKD